MTTEAVQVAPSAESGETLVKVTLVPVEVFGVTCDSCQGETGYGLMDAVEAWSDCNRAIGHIFRKDDEHLGKYRNPDDVITVYVPQSEMWKFDKQFAGD